MVNNLVEVRDLVVDRGGRRVLHGLDITLEQGGVTGLLGPSGCGKSTLMRALVGVQRLTSGRVRVAGLDAGSRELRSRVGYVTQAASVYDDLTVRENLQFFARVLGVAGAAVEEAIATVDLTSHADQVVGRLSGGQSSRASLAVALLNTPDLLVLDEPTVGLDPVARDSVWGRVRELQERYGATVLLTTHYMEEADALCDRVGLMHQGRLRAVGAPAELKAALAPEASLEDVFRHYTGGRLDDAEKGGMRAVRNTRRTARRMG